MTANPDSGGTVLQAHRSHPGKRPELEDRWDVREFQTADGRPATFALLAGGIGGHERDTVASEMAKNGIPALLLANPPAASEITSRLKAVLEESGQAIYRASLEASEKSGTGTACTAVVIADERLYLAHVGGSRAYVLRNGQLHQLTVDHTWADEALRAGRSPAEIRTHPNRRAITRYLGMSVPVNADTRYQDLSGKLVQTLDAGPFFLEPGDTVMLSSGSISDALNHRQMAKFLAYPDCQAAAVAMVSAALKAGASDNITVIVLRLAGAAVVTPEAVAAPGKRPYMLAIVVGLAVLLVALAAAGVLARSKGQGPTAAAPPTARVARGATDTSTPAPGPAVETTPEGPGSTPQVVADATRLATALPGNEARVATVATATEEATEVAAGVVLPTLEPKETVAATPALLNTSETATARVALATTATVTGPAPSGEPTSAATLTPLPTSTPVATSTLLQTGTPLPTKTQPSAGASPTTASTVSTRRGVILLKPADGAIISGETEFAWQDEPGFSLGRDEQYELIVWEPEEDPLGAGRSPVGATTERLARSNLTGVESALGLTDQKTYFWGIRLLASGIPTRMISGGRMFVYERAPTGRADNGDSAPGCTGPLCP